MRNAPFNPVTNVMRETAIHFRDVRTKRTARVKTPFCLPPDISCCSHRTMTLSLSLELCDAIDSHGMNTHWEWNWFNFIIIMASKIVNRIRSLRPGPTCCGPLIPIMHVLQAASHAHSGPLSTLMTGKKYFLEIHERCFDEEVAKYGSDQWVHVIDDELSKLVMISHKCWPSQGIELAAVHRTRGNKRMTHDCGIAFPEDWSCRSDSRIQDHQMQQVLQEAEPSDRYKQRIREEPVD